MITSTTSSNLRALFVWDFDWTIVNCNSDEYIPAQFLKEDDVNAGFRALFSSGKDWHACVEAIVGRAVEETGAKRNDLLDAARKMPYLHNVRQVLDDIHFCDCDVGQMILSDGNTMFIQAFLEENQLVGHFTNGVVSNIGVWDDDINNHNETANLRVVHQSEQYGGHSCKRCHRSPNLCKTQALRDVLNKIMAKQKSVEKGKVLTTTTMRPRIVYIGDGFNDACPVLNVLDEGDIVLARGGEKWKDSNHRAGVIMDEEAINMEKEGEHFGILPALRSAKKGASPLVPTCQVLEWHTGAKLRALVQKVLEDLASENDSKN